MCASGPLKCDIAFLVTRLCLKRDSIIKNDTMKMLMLETVDDECGTGGREVKGSKNS